MASVRGKLDAKGRAHPGLRFDRDPSPQGLHVSAYDVHPDAPSGDLRDLVGGREARSEDQVEHFTIGQPPVGIQKPTLSRLGGDLVPVESASVVGDFQHDGAARLICQDANRSLTWLSGLLALVRWLDSVIHGVPDHVDERVRDHIDHGAVDLRVFPFGQESNRLAALTAQVAHHPRDLPEGGLERHHAQGGAQILQLPKDLGGVSDLLGQLAAIGQDDPVLSEHGMRDHQLPDHVDEPVEPVGPDAYRRFAARRG